jgi:hypothetical protein
MKNAWFKQMLKTEKSSVSLKQLLL